MFAVCCLLCSVGCWLFVVCCVVGFHCLAFDILRAACCFWVVCWLILCFACCELYPVHCFLLISAAGCCYSLLFAGWCWWLTFEVLMLLLLCLLVVGVVVG